MTEEKRLTVYQLEKDFLADLEECKTEILEDKYPEDIIHERADSWVPVYNYDRLQLACDDLWLGYPSESGLTHGCEDAYDIIGINIYEHLNNIGHEWLAHARKKAV